VSATDDLLLRHDAARPVVLDRPEPALGLVIVTCMDCRIDPSAILGVTVGEVHILRNAGGIVTDDTIRSLAISQHRLGTREIMVIQHTDCGMQGVSEEAFVDELRRSAGARPPFEIGAFTDVVASVRASVRKIVTSPFIQYRSEVTGFVFDVGQGRLRPVESAGAATE
jgi:carbonic anhydrase